LVTVFLGTIKLKLIYKGYLTATYELQLNLCSQKLGTFW